MKQIKCENCGAPFKDYKCPYCGTEYVVHVGDKFLDFMCDDVEIHNCNTTFAYQIITPVEISKWHKTMKLIRMSFVNRMGGRKNE